MSFWCILRQENFPTNIAVHNIRNIPKHFIGKQRRLSFKHITLFESRLNERSSPGNIAAVATESQKC